MASPPPFTLSRVDERDFAEIIEVQYRSFPDPWVRDVFVGPDTPENKERLRKEHIQRSKDEPQDYWIKVTDKTTGKIIAASNWKINPSIVPDHDKYEPTEFSWLQNDPKKLEKASNYIRTMIETRKKCFTEPYVQLYMCCTDPAYARRGAGSMMLKWGVDLADQLFLPAWVEASEAGSMLYQTHGFAIHVKKEGSGTLMYRPARPSTIEGGKSAP
ncbi:hypothetical protein BDZ85DRAFT_267075 [Elsinoe ampelina]|uniref:N-acetyltransferase domain-containing protein n=1 Tax=Elsinoe ampelina TaxID=302913 RepID=A0A6A6G4R1_9PEZI|nr:hypothetical protein BDZ85DRAFT_267075 [Elsinoe ampelina]